MVAMRVGVMLLLAIAIIGTGTDAFTTSPLLRSQAKMSKSTMMTLSRPFQIESELNPAQATAAMSALFSQDGTTKTSINSGSLLWQKAKRFLLLLATAFTLFTSGLATSTPAAHASSSPSAVRIEKNAVSYWTPDMDATAVRTVSSSTTLTTSDPRTMTPAQMTQRKQQLRLKLSKQQRLRKLTPAQREQLLQKRQQQQQQQYLQQQAQAQQPSYSEYGNQRHHGVHHQPQQQHAAAAAKRGLLAFTVGTVKLSCLAVAISAAILVGSDTMAGDLREKLQKGIGGGRGRTTTPTSGDIDKDGNLPDGDGNNMPGNDQYMNNQIVGEKIGVREPIEYSSRSESTPLASNSQNNMGPMPELNHRQQQQQGGVGVPQFDEYQIRQQQPGAPRVKQFYKQQRDGATRLPPKVSMLRKSEDDEHYEELDKAAARPQGKTTTILGLRRRGDRKIHGIATASQPSSLAAAAAAAAATPLTTNKRKGNNGFEMIFQQKNPFDNLPGGKNFRRTAMPTINTSVADNSQKYASRYMMWKGIAKASRKIDKRAITYVSALHGSHDVDDLVIRGKNAFFQDGVTPVYATEGQIAKPTINTGSDESSKHFALSYMFNKWLARKMRRDPHESDVTYVGANGRDDMDMDMDEDDQRHIHRLGASQRVPLPRQTVSSVHKKPEWMYET